jgi:hypothetical protein
MTDGAPRLRREVNAYYSLGVAASYTGHIRIAETMLNAGLEGEAVRQNRRLEIMLRCGTAVLRYVSGRWDGLAGDVERLLSEVTDYASSRIDLDLVSGGLAIADGRVDTVQSAKSVYEIPTRQVTTGTFQLQIGARLAAPALTVTSIGRGAPSVLDARYPDGGYDQTVGDGNDTTTVAHGVPAFASPGNYQLVDAGTGTPAELAAANVQGKLALIHEVPDPNAVYSFQVPIDAVIANAAAAGAAGVVYAVADSGPPVRSVTHSTTIPVAVVPYRQGQALAIAARAGPVTVHTGGQPVSPYLLRPALDRERRAARQPGVPGEPGPARHRLRPLPRRLARPGRS